MPVLAEVIPLHRQPSPTGRNPLSADDRELIANLIGVLTDEIFARGEDGSVRARIYFYFRFHRYSVEHWLGWLLTREGEENRQLAKRLGDAFHYVTSVEMLDSSIVNSDDYRGKLNQLANHLRTLLLSLAS
jgi:hypothetical protein